MGVTRLEVDAELREIDRETVERHGPIEDRFAGVVELGVEVIRIFGVESDIIEDSVVDDALDAVCTAIVSGSENTHGKSPKFVFPAHYRLEDRD